MLRFLAIFLITATLAQSLVGCGPADGADGFSIPDYSGSPYVSVNGGTPFFTEGEITDEDYESYSELDPLGRCGVAMACVGLELMPTEPRGDISSVFPTGFYYDGKSNNNQYSFIEDGYIYNRCHLIGFQLSGENANPKNLITGTRYMNIYGMLHFENKVADYVKKTGNHVMLRVTPRFEGYDYLPKGVLMEGYSVEDQGRGVEFCVFVYNVQPGVIIDYFTGNNRPDVAEGYSESTFTPAPRYVVNTSGKKYHRPECHYSELISQSDKFLYYGKAAEFREEYPEYAPCGVCLP